MNTSRKRATRKAILRTYLNNRGDFRDEPVRVLRGHRFSDGPYADTIPFVVGSNQTVLPPPERRR